MSITIELPATIVKYKLPDGTVRWRLEPQSYEYSVFADQFGDTKGGGGSASEGGTT